MKEQLYGHDYVEGEDPKLYVSNKTNRGPLTDGWIEEYWNEVNYFSTFIVIFFINCSNIMCFLFLFLLCVLKMTG